MTMRKSISSKYLFHTATQTTASAGLVIVQSRLVGYGYLYEGFDRTDIVMPMISIKTPVVNKQLKSRVAAQGK